MYRVYKFKYPHTHKLQYTCGMREKTRDNKNKSPITAKAFSRFKGEKWHVGSRILFPRVTSTYDPMMPEEGKTGQNTGRSQYILILGVSAILLHRSFAPASPLTISNLGGIVSSNATE